MQDKFEFKLADGSAVRVQVRSHTRHSTREYFAKSRVYVWNVTERNAALVEAEKALPAPRPRGEDPENDRAYSRFNRAYVKAWRAEAAAALKELTVKEPRLSAWLDRAKLKFSRNAGCSCPCSPGGVLDSRVLFEGGPVDIHINLAKPVG